MTTDGLPRRASDVGISLRRPPVPLFPQCERTCDLLDTFILALSCRTALLPLRFIGNQASVAATYRRRRARFYGSVVADDGVAPATKHRRCNARTCRPPYTPSPQAYEYLMLPLTIVRALECVLHSTWHAATRSTRHLMRWYQTPKSARMLGIERA